MKSFVLKVIAACGLLGLGYVAHESGRLPEVLPTPQAPLSTSIQLFGPEEGFTGQDYFFHAEIRGDHGRPEWQVPANVDITTTPDGIAARIRCELPGAYPISIAVGGKDGSVSTNAMYFEAIDLNEEIDSAVSQATAVAASEPPPPTLVEIVQSLPSFPQDQGQRTEAASKFMYMAKRLRNGLVPSGNDPVALLRNELGDPYLEFLGDVDKIVTEFRLTGDVTTAASLAPVFEEIAAALGG